MRTLPKIDEVEATFNSKRYKAAELKSYSSLTQLCMATGLDKRLLMVAKKAAWPGFTANHGVNWNKLKPVLEKRYEELLVRLDDGKLSVVEKIREADLRIKLAQARKAESKILEPDDVKKLLVELAARWSAIIIKEWQQLYPRLAGKSEPEIKVDGDKALKAIFDVWGQAPEMVDGLE